MTATTTVTLEEVIAAAGCRRAALAPETSGYFALAIGDATSRLPLRIEDRAISLTTEGTVMVPRKGDLTAPADAARTLREVLARLLAVSAGSMPGLAQAARPRIEADVDGVVAGIEAALIPVNRAAARRALARLARETVRARDRGKFRGLRTMPSLAPGAPSAAIAAPAHAATASCAEPAPFAAPSPATLPAAPVGHAPASLAAPIQAAPAPLAAPVGHAPASLAAPIQAAPAPLAAPVGHAPASLAAPVGHAPASLDAPAPAPLVAPAAPALASLVATAQPAPIFRITAPADVAPDLEANYATDGGAEAVFEASDTPQPYAPSADAASSPFAFGVTSPIEAAPVEPVAVMPEATEAPEPMLSDACEGETSNDARPIAAPPGEDAGPMIVPAPILAVGGLTPALLGAASERAIPPSRQTTPTITGVGDVGVYIAAALEPAARRYELSSTDRTAPWPVGSGGVAPSPLSRENAPASAGSEAPRESSAFEVTGSMASDLGDLPVAPLAAPHDDDTNIELPLVRAEPAVREPSFPRITTGITAIAPTPRARAAIQAAAPVRVGSPTRLTRTTTSFGLGPVRGGADLAPSEQSSVDDLLARFNTAGVRDERRVARTLKTFAGLDATAAPPVVWESPRPAAVHSPLPPTSAAEEDVLPRPIAKPSWVAKLRLMISAAIVLVGLFGTVTLWQRRAEILRAHRAAMPAAPARPTPPPMPAEEPHAGVDR